MDRMALRNRASTRDFTSGPTLFSSGWHLTSPGRLVVKLTGVRAKISCLRLWSYSGFATCSSSADAVVRTIDAREVGQRGRHRAIVRRRVARQSKGERRLVELEQRWSELYDTLVVAAPATARSIRVGIAASVQPRQVDGYAFTPELSRLFELQGGQSNEGGHSGYFLPMEQLISLERALELRSAALAGSRRLADRDTDFYQGGFDGVVARSTEAGSSALITLPAYLPISESVDGGRYYVDLRPGVHHGCVRWFSRDGADEGGPLWDSIATMLANVRTSVVTGTLIHGQWAPVFEEGGYLDWQPAVL